MLYLLYGTDSAKARKKLHKLTESLLSKKKDASFTRVEAELFEPPFLESFVKGQGLFSLRQMVVFDHVFENPEAKELIVNARKEIAASPNIFFILEGVLDKATLTKLETCAERVMVFGETKVTKGKSDTEPFNSFALGDALGARNAQRLWLLYMQARRRNVSPEELHGVLFWQAKNMLLAARSESAVEAGMHPFVYKKALSFVKNFSENELRNMLRNLVTLSHDARHGLHDFDTALERFTLSM